jgi:hypothetical protein
MCYNSQLYCMPIVGSSEKNLLRHCNMFHITWINLFVKCMNQIHFNLMTNFYLYVHHHSTILKIHIISIKTLFFNNNVKQYGINVANYKAGEVKI